ncbi:MAG: nascent polypeptide-associated complex protein [Candidatus Altarchaeaceae archaeon]
MFPGIGGMNPRQMQAMLKKMGIATEEINAVEVTIKKNDGKILIIRNPDVIKMTFQGNSIFTISGNVEELEEIKERSEKVEISDEDVELVVMQTGKSKEEARKILEEEEGDIAKAIMRLKGNENVRKD